MTKNTCIREKIKTSLKNVNTRYSNLAEGYLLSLKSMNYAPRTIESRISPLNSFFFFLAALDIENITDVTLEVLEKYRQNMLDRELEVSTVNQSILILKSFFSHLEENGDIFINPAADFKGLKETKKLPCIPTQEEIKALLSVIDITTASGIRNRAIFETTYSCGLRLNELTELTVFSPDLKNAALRVMGKGRKERMIPLSSPAVYWLGKYLAGSRTELLKGNIDNEALWVDQYGNALKWTAVYGVIKKCREDAGIENSISIHSIRRACATHMLQNGAGPVYVQMLLGHAGLGHLARYLEVSISELGKMHRKSKPGR